MATGSGTSEMDVRLGKITRQILDLHARALTLSDEGKAAYDEQLDPLRRQEDALRKKIDVVRNVQGEERGRLREGVDRELGVLQQSIEKTILRLREVD